MPSRPEAYVHIHTPARDGDPRTLVLLHGTGGNEREFLRLGDALAPTAARLSLRGDVDENGMARFFRRLGEGVYDMADLATRTAALAAFLPRALAEAGRDPAQAIGIGYSNGANILANLLFTAPQVLRRAVLMHPLIPFDPAPQPGLAGAHVLVTSGARDPISPPPLTAHLEDYLARQHVHLTRARHMGGHDIRPEELEAIRSWMAHLPIAAPVFAG